jgi:hypothetical protein
MVEEFPKQIRNFNLAIRDTQNQITAQKLYNDSLSLNFTQIQTRFSALNASVSELNADMEYARKAKFWDG